MEREGDHPDDQVDDAGGAKGREAAESGDEDEAGERLMKLDL